jgi:hypothetical protein
MLSQGKYSSKHLIIYWIQVSFPSHGPGPGKLDRAQPGFFVANDSFMGIESNGPAYLEMVRPIPEPVALQESGEEQAPVKLIGGP